MKDFLWLKRGLFVHNIHMVHFLYRGKEEVLKKPGGVKFKRFHLVGFESIKITISSINLPLFSPQLFKDGDMHVAILMSNIHPGINNFNCFLFFKMFSILLFYILYSLFIAFSNE